MSRGTLAEDDMSLPTDAGKDVDAVVKAAGAEAGVTLLSPGGIRRKRSKPDVPQPGVNGGDNGDERDEVSPVEPPAGDEGTPRSLTDQELRILELEALNQDLKVDLEKSTMENDRLKGRLKTILWEYLPKQRKTEEIPPIDKDAIAFDEKGQIGFRDYTLRGFVGSGHFGEVHAAVNNESNDRYAIKILQLENQLALEDVVALEQEIRAIKVLTHPNIVRLFDLIHGKNQICLIMTYLPGGNVYEYISTHHPLGVTEIQTFFAGVLQAVGYMHQRGFSHRDIKPENVLLDTDKNPVLIDFGLSTKTQPGQMVKSACGTPGFMAPELSTSRPLLPMPTDLWATGCLLVELFGGNDSVKPLNDISPSNAEEKVNALFDEKLTPNKHIPEDALDVIDKLICIDPKKRHDARKISEHQFVAPFIKGDGGADSNGSRKRSMQRMNSFTPSNRRGSRVPSSLDVDEINRSHTTPVNSNSTRNSRMPITPCSTRSPKNLNSSPLGGGISRQRSTSDGDVLKSPYTGRPSPKNGRGGSPSPTNSATTTPGGMQPNPAFFSSPAAGADRRRAGGGLGEGDQSIGRTQSLGRSGNTPTKSPYAGLRGRDDPNATLPTITGGR
mmetsp:Transcript_9864/g.25377  ORF Transcript_9864/g.25377 Transcript_9864/m.25377 type:complete len:612 (-) Transcript_9864:312-2147(-)